MQLFTKFLMRINYYNLTDQEQLKNEVIEVIEELMDVMGVSLHHDAITGTSVDYVSTDLFFRLYNV